MFIEDKLYFELAEKVLEKIKGKLNFSISKEERIILAEEILKEITTQENNPHFFQVYQDPRLKKSFLKRFFSYEEIEEFIFDPQVEDIAINGTGPIYVHTTDKGLVKTNKRFKDFKYLNFFLKKILILSGREENKKMIDFELPYIEGRVNIVHSPFGPQITITKIKETPLSIIELIHKGSLNYRVAAFLWLAVEGFGGLRPANILIAGGPGAGKTTLLNALLSFIPSTERVVIIEDTLELNTCFMDNFSRLESDEDLSLEDLVRNSLRMRPERIIIGEVRGREAQDMMTAMNIGKYCMGTIHASNTKEVFSRLESAPMNIPPPLLNLIDIFIVLRKFTQAKRVYRVIEEISETSLVEQKRPLVSSLWKYNYRKSQLEEVSPFTIFREKLSEATGKTPIKILEEWDLRSKLLYILHQRGVYTFSEITRFCSFYSREPAKAIEKLRTTRENILKTKIRI